MSSLKFFTEGGDHFTEKTKIKLFEFKKIYSIIHYLNTNAALNLISKH